MPGTPERLVVSIDINDDMTCISYASLSGRGVTTISSGKDAQDYGIPTRMFKNFDTVRWSFGAKAAIRAGNENGKLYDDLLSAVIGEGRQEDPEAMKRLGTFLAHCLELAAEAVDKEYMDPSIAALAICVKKIDSGMLERLEHCVQPLRAVVKDIRFLTRRECFYYYTLSQPPEIWRASVVLADYSDEDFVISHLKVKKGVQRSSINITEEHHPELLPFDDENPEKMDERLCETFKEKLYNDVEARGIKVSSVYLSGLNLEGDWPKQTLKFLCGARRVFQGQNLYSKGACYAVRDQLTQGYISNNFIFLNGEKVNYNLGIRMICEGAEMVCRAVTAGVSWYDLRYETDVMLGEVKDMTIVLESFPEGDEINHVIRLDSFPDRKKRTTRAHVKFYMKEPGLLKVEVTDRGLGELIPATGTTVTEEIKI